MENEKHEENSVSTSLDLMIEILRRLPSKAVMRFKCLSKQYSSIIRSRIFVNSFYSYSSNKPRRLLFSSMTANELVIYSATMASTGASHVMTVPGNILGIRAPPVRGLICYSIKPDQHVICNPTTRQLLHLPLNQTRTKTEFDEDVLFGYEPISSRFKVISIVTNSRSGHLEFWIFTVGDGNSWRRIQGIPYYYRPISQRPRGVCVCINGVLYYPCLNKSGNQYETPNQVVSFDLNSEKFGLIKLPPSHWRIPKLIDLQGKLAFVQISKEIHVWVLEIQVWVLEDAEKHEWSYKLYNLPSSLKYDISYYFHSRAVGICEGEIVFVPPRRHKHGFTTWYFNLEKNTIREVFVTQMPLCLVYANHVENLISL